MRVGKARKARKRTMHEGASKAKARMDVRHEGVKLANSLLYIDIYIC